MDMTHHSLREEFLEWSHSIERLVRCRNSGTAEIIAGARRSFREDKFVITILGKAKRGKSTLINALLGRQDDLLAPIDRLPASNAISRYRSQEHLTCTVHFRATQLRTDKGQAITPVQVREYVTEEGNPGNRKQVELVDLAGPFPGLDPDVILVDTPGAGSLHDYHDELLQAFIPQSDAVIFLVTARMPLDQDELELLQRVRAADIRKLLFVMNKVDETSPTELVEARAHNASHLARLGFPDSGPLLELSAKQAFLGNIENSGLSELAARIREIVNTSKGAVLLDRLSRRVLDAAGPVLQGLEAESRFLLATPEERADQFKKLQQARRELEVEQPFIEQKFRIRWQQAIEMFRVALHDAQREVVRRVQELISQSSLARLDRVIQELPENVGKITEEVLRESSRQLECSLQDASDTLRSDYPRLRWESGGISLDRSGTGWVMALGMATAATSTATGTGIILGAQAATAAAVTYVASPSLIGATLTQLIGTHSGFLTTTAVPTAIPFWVAAAGPIGWTLAGIGILAVPFAWTVSRTKQKDRLSQQAMEQVKQLFQFLLEERLPLLERSADLILEEFWERSRRELSELEHSFERIDEDAGSAETAEHVRTQFRQLQDLLSHPPKITP